MLVVSLGAAFVFSFLEIVTQKKSAGDFRKKTLKFDQKLKGNRENKCNFVFFRLRQQILKEKHIVDSKLSNLPPEGRRNCLGRFFCVPENEKNTG